MALRGSLVQIEHLWLTQIREGNELLDMAHSGATSVLRRLRSTDQFTSGRRRSHATPVSASMSGQTSAGTRSFFQREMEAFDTVRPFGVRRAVSSSASFDDPLTARQASWSASYAPWRGVESAASIVVSNYDTCYSRLSKLQDCNKEPASYAEAMGKGIPGKTYEPFRQRLKAAREAAGMKGEELGDLVGYTKATVSKWERGGNEPNLTTLVALCGLFEVTADWMLGRESRTLSAEAYREALAFDRLDPEAQRKWRAMRLTLFTQPTKS